MEAALSKEIPQASQCRNAGIDLLRIVAAFYIILFHMLGAGGLLNDSTVNAYPLAKAMYTWCYCAVNIYGVISGYVGYSSEERPIRISNIGRLWLQVAFYDLLFYLLAVMRCTEDFSVRTLFTMATPLLHNNHWYFTAYSMLFFIMPLLNAGVRNCSNKHLFLLLGMLFFLFLPIELWKGYFFTRNGRCFTWLLLLYLVGAILKKTQIGAGVRPLVLIVCIAAVSLLSYGIGRCDLILRPFDIYVNAELVEVNVYPGHLFIAVCYVLLFAGLKPGKLLKKFISFGAPGTFAVYVINTQYNVWKETVDFRFVHWSTYTPPVFLLCVVGAAIGFTLTYLGIDWFRRKLFSLFRKKT